MQEMKTYIEHRRKTLRTYVEEEQPKLWEEMQNTRAPARNVRKFCGGNKWDRLKVSRTRRVAGVILSGK